MHERHRSHRSRHRAHRSPQESRPKDEPRSNPFAGFLHAAVLLPVPVLAVLFFGDGVPRAFGPTPDAIAEVSASDFDLGRKFPGGDLRDLAHVERAQVRLQREAVAGERELTATANPEPGVSPLQLWERIDRTATRSSATLDYFLGFGF